MGIEQETAGTAEWEGWGRLRPGHVGVVKAHVGRKYKMSGSGKAARGLGRHGEGERVANATKGAGWGSETTKGAKCVGSRCPQVYGDANKANKNLGRINGGTEEGRAWGNGVWHNAWSINKGKGAGKAGRTLLNSTTGNGNVRGKACVIMLGKVSTRGITSSTN